MRDEAERLVREAMEKKSVSIKKGDTRIEAKCGKCGAVNKVSAAPGESSCFVNRRPSDGVAPNIGNRPSVTSTTRTSSGSAIPVTLEVPTDARLPEHVDVTAYFVVSEALTNAAKHAHASRVQVTVDAADGNVRLTISDAGVGGADPTRGSGLVGLKDRVEAIGGTLTVHSRTGHGTRLIVEVPVKADRPGSAS